LHQDEKKAKEYHDQEPQQQNPKPFAGNSTTLDLFTVPAFHGVSSLLKDFVQVFLGMSPGQQEGFQTRIANRSKEA